MINIEKRYNKLFLNDVRKAVDDYNLIEDGDNILVALSGGKDSIFLLYVLILLKHRSYLNFNIKAIHIDIGLNLDMGGIACFCKDNNIEFIYKSIDIGNKIKTSKKSPCYICSSFKRGSMATFAKDNKMNKIAYGHHLTDLINTFYLNILKENQFRTFKASTYNPEHDISLIRPLIYIPESTIEKIVKDENLPLAKGDLCPYDSKNERNKINNIIKYSNSIYDNFENKILNTLKNSDLL